MCMAINSGACVGFLLTIVSGSYNVGNWTKQIAFKVIFKSLYLLTIGYYEEMKVVAHRGSRVPLRGYYR